MIVCVVDPPSLAFFGFDSAISEVVNYAKKIDDWMKRGGRAEIAARVASFKETQQKFEREREEYYATTLGKAWSGFNRPSFWT